MYEMESHLVSEVKSAKPVWSLILTVSFSSSIVCRYVLLRWVILEVACAAQVWSYILISLRMLETCNLHKNKPRLQNVTTLDLTDPHVCMLTCVQK